MFEASGDKAALRSRMRRLRREIPDRTERSVRIDASLRSLDTVAAAHTLLVFDAVPGEPELATFVMWCQSVGKVVAAPEDGVEPGWPDVVVVPGVAFTAAGHRLGQGGGWYDRFLADIRPDCHVVGVCFDMQVVDSLPVEPHDVAMQQLVSDERVYTAAW